MPRLIAASMMVVALSTVGAMAQTAAPSPAEFTTQVSMANRFEIEEAELALKQSSDEKVKAFAQMMVQDHTAAEKGLESAAKAAGAAPVPQLDAAHRQLVDALKGKSGAEFDKAYIADQLAAHSQAVEILTGFSASGGDPALKDWAKAALPIVKKHLDHVRSMGAV